jgi:hypothetical protein
MQANGIETNSCPTDCFISKLQPKFGFQGCVLIRKIMLSPSFQKFKQVTFCDPGLN